MLQITYPLSHGVIRNFDDMLHGGSYTFENKLKINPRECKILLTEPPLNPNSNRQKDCYIHALKCDNILINLIST